MDKNDKGLSFYLEPTGLEDLEKLIEGEDVVNFEFLERLSKYDSQVVVQILEGLWDIMGKYDEGFSISSEEFFSALDLKLNSEELPGFFDYIPENRVNPQDSQMYEGGVVGESKKDTGSNNKRFKKSYRDPNRQGVYSGETIYGVRTISEEAFNGLPNQEPNSRLLKKVKKLLRGLNRGEAPNSLHEKLEDVQRFPGSIFPTKSFHDNLMADVGRAIDSGTDRMWLRYSGGKLVGYNVLPKKG